jgi:hypothetical protein
MEKQEVKAYLDATRDVEGWFFPIDAYLFAFIDRIQKREGIAGNLFEIGVHHGKTAIFLGRAASADEILGVCDVFEGQELNIDRSGEGSRTLFERNMRALAPLEERRLRVFPILSSLLTVDDTTAACRLVHIDGGHRPEDVVADLHTAARALLPDGVVAVDDLFNPSWPGVGEGFYRFTAAEPDVFAPILIGGNKVFLTRPGAAARYEKHWVAMSDFIATQPFKLDFKEWLGRRVQTANRQVWVDLDPSDAARRHSV